MNSTNWVIAIVVVAILGVGAYFVFDNDSDDAAMMEDGSGQMKTNPNATGTDAMMQSTPTDSMHGDDMMASGTVKVNVY